MKKDNRYSRWLAVAVILLGLSSTSPVPVRAYRFSDGKLVESSFPAFAVVQAQLSEADFNRDGVEESLVLHDFRVQIFGSGNSASLGWQSPPQWLVQQAQVGDLNRDRAPEAVLLVRRPFKPWPVDRFLQHGGRINSFQDSQGTSCHLILIGWKRSKYGELWAGSALADPLYTVAAVDLDGNGRQELLALEGRYNDPEGRPARALTAWEWNGFGFTLLDRLSGSFSRMLPVISPHGIFILTD